MLTPKEFLKKFTLEFSLPLKETRALKKVITLAQEQHALWSTTEKDIKAGRIQYYYTTIHCPTTNFAKAYWYIGLLYAERVLPIWNKRNTKKPKKKK